MNFSCLPGSNWRESLQINLDISLDSFRSDVSPDHPDLLDTESLKKKTIFSFRFWIDYGQNKPEHIPHIPEDISG